MNAVIRLLLCLAALAAGASFAQAPAPRWFIVHLALGPAWDASKPPNQQAGFGEHSANLRKLREAGQLALGARYADKGLLVVRAADAAAARALFAADPMIAGQQFTLQVDELRVFYPGQVGETQALRAPLEPPTPQPPPLPAK